MTQLILSLDFEFPSILSCHLRINCLDYTDDYQQMSESKLIYNDHLICSITSNNFSIQRIMHHLISPKFVFIDESTSFVTRNKYWRMV